MTWKPALGILFIVLPALAAEPATRPVRTGEFTLRLEQRSAASGIEAMGRRAGWSARAVEASGQEADYDLSKESFEVYVPPACAKGPPCGLLVWVNAGDSGRILVGGWKKVLDKRRIIWIGANKSGNERPVWCRMGLAIDAATSMARQCNIDPDRIYISGLSGGGRVASMVAVCFPDIFHGGLPFVGCNYFRDVPSPGNPGRAFRRSFTPPPAHLLDLAKTRSRFALLTGQKDMNREQTKANADAMKADGFKHVTYFEVPGMGHSLPDATWFEKAIEAIEPPPAARTPDR